MNRLVGGLAGLVLIVPALQGCTWFEEKICRTGEVVVRSGGGGWCEAPKPGDPACPSGDILVKDRNGDVKGCTPNVYLDPPPSTQPTPTTPADWTTTNR